VIDTLCKETVLYFPTNLRGNYSPEEAWGKLAKGCGDYSWRKSGEACGGLWRLLPEEAWGKLAEGRGDYSWRRCRRCSETLPRPSPGDIS